MNKFINMSYKKYNEALDLLQKNEILHVKDAKEKLEKAVVIYNKDIDILNLLGVCEYMLCNFDKACICWSKSIKINSESNKANEYMKYLKSTEFNEFVNEYNQGIEFYYNKEYEKSINIFNNIIKIHEELIEPYELLIMCYVDLNKKSEYLSLYNSNEKKS